MVVENDNISTTLADVCDFNAELVPQSTAIKSSRMLREAAFNGRRTQATTFLSTQQEAGHLPTDNRQGTLEQRQGGDPIHVVVAIKNNPFTSLDRVPDTIGGLLHFRKEEGICQPS